jgi:putative transposase
LDRSGIRVFRGIFPWLGGAEDDEGITVLGCANGVHSQAGSRWRSGCRHLPEGRNQPGDLFQWKKKYEGMQPPEMRRLKQLEDENAKLKKIVADLSLDREMVQDVIRRNVWSAPPLQVSGTIRRRQSA